MGLFLAEEPFSLSESLRSAWCACSSVSVANRIIAWHQRRMKFSLQVLGSHSILADPRQADMKGHVNDATSGDFGREERLEGSQL